MENWAYYTMKNLADLYQKKSILFYEDGLYID